MIKLTITKTIIIFDVLGIKINAKKNFIKKGEYYFILLNQEMKLL